ncbi:hypothetical protein BLNAU_8551 [Blattamonas nauphoetae]|uniref:Uncharacterized protein n=1 Tax=Blattamonas nauphoetae TaxID=2049346 RepID=A0ABQ9XYE6_9EUKA|nr:hypothetical protein BLNAU_8551 [Blattamonas nauphoetae]
MKSIHEEWIVIKPIYVNRVERQKWGVFVIKDGSHCVDLHTPAPSDSQPLKNVRRYEIEMLKDWLAQNVVPVGFKFTDPVVLASVVTIGVMVVAFILSLTSSLPSTIQITSFVVSGDRSDQSDKKDCLPRSPPVLARNGMRTSFGGELAGLVELTPHWIAIDANDKRLLGETGDAVEGQNVFSKRSATVGTGTASNCCDLVSARAMPSRAECVCFSCVRIVWMGVLGVFCVRQYVFISQNELPLKSVHSPSQPEHTGITVHRDLTTYRFWVRVRMRRRNLTENVQTV